MERGNLKLLAKGFSEQQQFERNNREGLTV